jgi:hypothetical protein
MSQRPPVFLGKGEGESVDVHQSKESFQFLLEELFVPLAKGEGASWQDDFIQLNFDLPDQKVTTCTLLKHQID